MLDNGANAGGVMALGNSLVIMEKNGGKLPTLLGIWPGTPPFGPGVHYVIQNHIQPSVDTFTNLVGVPVLNQTTNQLSWFVLDISQPALPKVVAQLQNTVGRYAALSNGVLYSVAADGNAHANQVVAGIAGVDALDCSLYVTSCADPAPGIWAGIDATYSLAASIR